MSQGNGDGAAKCRISTCLINDKKIEPCAALIAVYHSVFRVADTNSLNISDCSNGESI